MKKLFVLVTLAFATSVFAEGWDRYNNPNIYVPIMPNKAINYNFASLPLESQLESDTLGWSGHYWPFMYGGITYRWNQPGFKPFSNKFPTQAEILRMTEAQLAELSPAERSEEHTSELQSRENLVCRLLLEKKKQNN